MKNYHPLNVFSKNRLFFYRKLFSNIKFRVCLELLMEEYNKQQDASDVLLSTMRGKNWDFNNRIRLHTESFNKVGQLKYADGPIFLDKVENFLRSFSLGREWFFTITTLIFLGKFCPPDENLYIDGSGKLDFKRVVLILNPDTSIEDINGSLKTIRKLQKKLWPNFKKINITNKMFQEFSEVFHFDVAKMYEAHKESMALLSYYEQKLYRDIEKSYGREEAIKKVNQPSLEGPRRKKTFKPKNKVFDADLIKKIEKSLNEKGKKMKESSKNFLDRIRQTRKRQKP